MQEELRARQRILSALDEIVAQCVVQAELLKRQNGAAPMLVTEGVVEWVRRVSLALARYREGMYAQAEALADITEVEKSSNREELPL